MCDIKQQEVYALYQIYLKNHKPLKIKGEPLPFHNWEHCYADKVSAHSELPW